ncbi:hypothetical protein H5410_021788 [Solanum commersonii]|uniref:Late blight resistance protein R1A-like N-terminal domain-containing protein n=1 Tax=Solanum commersonii TaxID=4109 RepID=A0A9J5ZC08_SOLCO|nr:hypothetical protein H5410_021788 [Solanum commersonii]
MRLPSNDQIATLQVMHNQLRDNLIHYPQLYLDIIDFVIGYVGLLIYSLFDIKEGNEDMMIEDVNQELGLRIVDLIKVSTTSFTRHFLAILRHVTGEDSNRREKCANELDDAFHRTLSSKRYLVLVDEDDLSPCGHDGSKIILTTPHIEVANCATSISGLVHLRMLNDDES